MPYCPNHRAHTEWQLPLSGVYSIMMEKLAQPGFTLSTITKLWFTIQLRGQIHSPYFYSFLYVFCSPNLE